ncbi:BDNF/NT-3 growth factors receptor-like [Genypterus blacodes]|uniref:BDNF/NT-3 growth factors receptor-like n=1 Tax=Genypterus blacodes TaxID=154954 RepID=UPI003F75E067
MMSAWRPWSGALPPPGRGSWSWRCCWWVLLLGIAVGSVGPWMSAEACPFVCTCSGSRISCVDQEMSITAFPLLQSEQEMENITDIYIANQSRFSSINDKDLRYYKNLRNLTVTNSRLTYVSKLVFQNNIKLQYLNLKDNNLSSLSWRIFKHLNISFLILTGNPLRCSCEIMWIKLWLGEEADTQELRCVEDGGWRKLLSRLTLSNCEVPMATLSTSKVTVKEGADVELTCNTSGVPSPELIWNMALVTSCDIETSGHMSVMRLSNLSSLDHNSKITCSAENIVGEKESSLLLDILFPPNITKLSDAIPDHHWCIPFSVSGNPEPQLKWMLNDKPVMEGMYIMTMIHDITEREYHGCLQLDNPTHFNNGLYTLVAKNIYGEDQKTVKAHFMEEPWDANVKDPVYYDSPPVEPPEDRVAVYVVVGIAAVAFTGFLLMLVILKFGGNSKFGIKGFVLFQNIPVEMVSR